MGETEWISTKSVKPTEKEEYESGLEAMLENRVEVYFVDKDTFKRINESEDYGFEILKTLTPKNKNK